MPVQKHFNSPSPDMIRQMSEKGFIIGKPGMGGQYIAAIRTYGVEESYLIKALYYNPVFDRWTYDGGSNEAVFSKCIRAYMPFPTLTLAE